MQMGRWFDPISGRWITPRPAPQHHPSSIYESETERGYRLARESLIWEATVASAQASQQQETSRD